MIALIASQWTRIDIQGLDPRTLAGAGNVGVVMERTARSVQDPVLVCSGVVASEWMISSGRWWTT
jgi:hypothetical protein